VSKIRFFAEILNLKIFKKMNELWLVSVPGEQFQNFTQIPNELGHNRSDFRLPELKVGTLDTLIQLR